MTCLCAESVKVEHEQTLAGKVKAESTPMTSLGAIFTVKLGEEE